jgi:excisionase family DNA binding protein
MSIRKPEPSKSSSTSPPLPESDGRTNLIAFERARRYLDVSRSTLLRYIYSRKLNAIKMDGGWRFHWSDIDRFVQRRTQKAA